MKAVHRPTPAQPTSTHPVLRTALTSTAIAVLGGLSASWLTEDFEVWTAEGARRRAVIEAPVTVPPATLLGAGLTGHSLHGLLASPGRVTLVSFIYTRCPSVCLALGSSFQQLQAAVSGPAMDGADSSADSGIKLLSISFDPAHDDIDQLGRYASLWRADPRHWRIATVPDAAQLQRLLQAWQVVVIPDALGGYEHNAALLVIDERGRLVRIFDEADSAMALAFARSLQRATHASLSS